MEERIVAADPVADPQGYRRELLALLGDDDPGEVLEATMGAVQERTRGLPGELVGRRPEPRNASTSASRRWRRSIPEPATHPMPILRTSRLGKYQP